MRRSTSVERAQRLAEMLRELRALCKAYDAKERDIRVFLSSCDYSGSTDWIAAYAKGETDEAAKSRVNGSAQEVRDHMDGHPPASATNGHIRHRKTGRLPIALGESSDNQPTALPSDAGGILQSRS